MNHSIHVFVSNTAVLLRVLLDAGMTVLTVIATDVDNGNNGSVTYSLKQVPLKAGQPLFSIDAHMGLITTRLTNALDREVQPIYHVVVQARDRGSPAMSGQSAGLFVTTRYLYKTQVPC